MITGQNYDKVKIIMQKSLGGRIHLSHRTDECGTLIVSFTAEGAIKFAHALLAKAEDLITPK